MKDFLKLSFFLILSSSVCIAGCTWVDKNKNNPEDILGKPPFAGLTDSIKRFPGEASLYFRRAEILSQNNLHEIANQDYKKSWDLKPDIQTALRYSSNLSVLGREKEAIGLLNDCIRQFPEEAEFKRLLGEAYIQSGNTKKAIGLYDSILQKDSLNFEAWFEKGKLLALAKDTIAAIASFKKAYSLQPVNTYALELAHLYAETKNDYALTICDEVLRKDLAHELVDPFFIKGIYYSNTAQYESAVIQYDSCIRRDWKFSEAYIEKGIAFFKQKNYDGALNVFRMAATVSNTDPDAYYWIGRCYEAVKKNGQAAEYYQRAVELDKDFPEAREALKRVVKLNG